MPAVTSGRVLVTGASGVRLCSLSLAFVLVDHGFPPSALVYRCMDSKISSGSRIFCGCRVSFCLSTKIRPLTSETDLLSLRSDSQVDFVVNRFSDYRSKVTGVIVPNIEAPGAYDEAVRGVDAIIHTASPVVWDWEDPSEIIDPAVKGATGILASASARSTERT